MDFILEPLKIVCPACGSSLYKIPYDDPNTPYNNPADYRHMDAEVNHCSLNGTMWLISLPIVEGQQVEDNEYPPAA